MKNENTIRGIKVDPNSTNSIYKTVDDLRCDFCGKKVASVFAFKPKESEEIRFTCFNECFIKSLKEMFIKSGDEYMLMCEIDDIRYSDKKETKKKVRSEMTLKLRYNIMKRDNFKCVICGKGMPEVEICVDHIMPVSKGGLSIESNLRTLCNKCNAGKGDE